MSGTDSSATRMSIGSPTPEDVPVLLEMGLALATFMGVPQNFFNTSENLSTALFSDPPRVEAIVARFQGEPAGFATWGLDYRFFSGAQAMTLDYVYVKPEFRSKPVAIAMLVYLLALAKRRDYLFIQGTVMSWNLDALRLYSLLKAQEVEARNFRLELKDVDWSLLSQYLPETAVSHPAGG